MPDILVIAYPWLKALHIVSVILWLGTQMLLPSLLAAFVFGTLLTVVVIHTAGQLPLWLGLKFALIFVLATLHGKLLTGVVGLVVGKPFW